MRPLCHARHLPVREFLHRLDSVKRRYSGEAVPDFDRSVVDGDRVAVLSRMKTSVATRHPVNRRVNPRFATLAGPNGDLVYQTVVTTHPFY